MDRRKLSLAVAAKQLKVSDRELRALRRRGRQANCAEDPQEWEGDQPGAPDETPEETSSRAEALLENGAEIVKQGHTWEQAAERLGVTSKYLRRLRYEARRDLAESLLEVSRREADSVAVELARLSAENRQLRAALMQIAEQTIQAPLNRLAHQALGHEPSLHTVALLAELEEEAWW